MSLADDLSDLLDGYSALLPELAHARNAYAEACAQEQIHRADTLRRRLEAGEPITATGHWADIDASTWTAEKLRRRAQMDNLVDRRDMIRDLLRLHGATDE